MRKSGNDLSVEAWSASEMDDLAVTLLAEGEPAYIMLASLARLTDDSFADEPSPGDCLTPGC
jgi:hypothetical protein